MKNYTLLFFTFILGTSHQSEMCYQLLPRLACPGGVSVLGLCGRQAPAAYWYMQAN